MTTLNEQNSKNILKEYIAKNDIDVSDISEADAYEMLEMWVDRYPQPRIATGHEHDASIQRGMWAIHQDEAMCIFIGQEFGTIADTHKWNIKEAILNRQSGESPLGAATAYAESVSDKYGPQL